MTKGHFHGRNEAPSIYCCLKGLGLAVMQYVDDSHPPLVAPFERGIIGLMAPYYAHRIVNIGEGNLVFIGFSRTDSGFMYGPLEKKGFKLLIVEKNGTATVTPNPKYS